MHFCRGTHLWVVRCFGRRSHKGCDLHFPRDLLPSLHISRNCEHPYLFPELQAEFATNMTTVGARRHPPMGAHHKHAAGLRLRPVCGNGGAGFHGGWGDGWGASTALDGWGASTALHRLCGTLCWLATGVESGDSCGSPKLRSPQLLPDAFRVRGASERGG